MDVEQIVYKVFLLIGSPYDDVKDPEFIFMPNEKDKMLTFIDICVENGHEIKIVKDSILRELEL